MTRTSACSGGKGWMLQRAREFLCSYHQPHGVGEGTDDNLSRNFCFGKSCQGSTTLKPPIPSQRLHHNLRKSFGLVPWGNEASVTLVPVCAHLRPGFSKNFQNPWAILAGLQWHEVATSECEEQRSPLGERQMLWGCSSQSWYPMRGVILSPQGKKTMNKHLPF